MRRQERALTEKRDLLTILNEATVCRIALNRIIQKYGYAKNTIFN